SHCGSNRLQAGFHKFAGGVLYLCVRHLILDRINQLDIAEGAGCLLNLPGDAFITFTAKAGWPVYRRVSPDFLLPVRADFAQVIGPNISCAASIRSMHYDDL